MVATWTATICGGINMSPLALIVFSGDVCWQEEEKTLTLHKLVC